MSDERGFEYRVCWEASSNISFHGESDWMPYDGFAESVEEVESDLYGESVRLSDVLEAALEESGFECWAEIREVIE